MQEQQQDSSSTIMQNAESNRRQAGQKQGWEQNSSRTLVLGSAAIARERNLSEAAHNRGGHRKKQDTQAQEDNGTGHKEARGGHSGGEGSTEAGRAVLRQAGQP